MSPTSFTNHVSLRVADAKRSLEFYEKNFGMTLLRKKTHGVNTFYMLGLTGPHSLYKDAQYFGRSGLLQLVHHEEATPETFVASNGNQSPNKGFGHICFSVKNLTDCCNKLTAANVKFQKRPEEGRQHDIAFVLDPDGYWIELFENKLEEEESTRLNHAMIRVKDKNASLDFYMNKLGLSLVHTMDFPDAKFTLYFLSYDPEYVKTHTFQQAEGLIELTYNYGSENDVTLKYHNGNEPPVGFRHLGLAVPDPSKVVKEGDLDVIAQRGDMYTVVDPDEYHIQLFSTKGYPE